MLIRLTAAGAALALLSACATLPPPPLAQAGSLDAGFGEASKYNAAVQIIDPDPVYAATDAQPGDNGDRGADTVRRYRTDQTRERHNQEARSRSTAGTAGGASGSGPR